MLSPFLAATLSTVIADDRNEAADKRAASKRGARK